LFSKQPLLVDMKANQYCFGKILFHLPEVFVNIDFAHRKKMFLTCFTQRKFFLWITGGLNFQGQIDPKLQYRMSETPAANQNFANYVTKMKHIRVTNPVLLPSVFDFLFVCFDFEYCYNTEHNR